MSSAEILPSLPRLVAGRVLDARLAALAWLLLDDGVPVLVAGPSPAWGDWLVDGLVAALPPDRRPGGTGTATVPRLVRVAGALGLSAPPGALRDALSATTGRSGLAATLEATDLAAVLGVLRSQGLTDDEISFLGVVLVLGAAAGRGEGRASVPVPGETSEPAGSATSHRAHLEAPAPGGGAPTVPSRVVAAHYLRPVARDAGGHVQRLGPAVLATWDPQRAVYDHFEWGIYPELAARTGRRAGDLEGEHRARAQRLRPDVPAGPA